jgi:hypothetical protein
MECWTADGEGAVDHRRWIENIELKYQVETNI